MDGWMNPASARKSQGARENERARQRARERKKERERERAREREREKESESDPIYLHGADSAKADARQQFDTVECQNGQFTQP